MKIKRPAKKRYARPAGMPGLRKVHKNYFFPWQNPHPNAPKHYKEYAESLMVGLAASEDIPELLYGLTKWLQVVTQKEKEIQRSKIIVTGSIPDGIVSN